MVSDESILIFNSFVRATQALLVRLIRCDALGHVILDVVIEDGVVILISISRFGNLSFIPTLTVRELHR